MPTIEQKYFIAIIPPDPLSTRIEGLKTSISESYQTKGALRSPAHITLHMPFLWNEAKEQRLEDALKEFKFTPEKIQIVLTGFESFPPRVVFIAVEESEPLRNLQRNLFRHCKVKLNLFNANYKDRPFHPHITLAFRDLKKDKFEALWNSLKDQPFQATFEATAISLLKHDGERWNRLKEFQLWSDGSSALQ